MWVFTPIGMFSVVCADGKSGQPDRNLLMVRARKRKHLDRLIRSMPKLLGECRVVETDHTDYCCRILVPKRTWARVVSTLAMRIGYRNFKSEAHRRGDAEYAAALHRVWSEMLRLQAKPASHSWRDNPEYEDWPNGPNGWPNGWR